MKYVLFICTPAGGEELSPEEIAEDPRFTSYIEEVRSRDVVKGGADLLVVQTNNATYMGTGQVDQQFAISRLRAIETGLPVVVAATNGVSGVIAPDGEVVERAPVRTQTVLSASVFGSGTSWGLRLGPWVQAALVTGAAVSTLLALRLRYRRRSPVTVDRASQESGVS